MGLTSSVSKIDGQDSITAILPKRRRATQALFGQLLLNLGHSFH